MNTFLHSRLKLKIQNPSDLLSLNETPEHCANEWRLSPNSQEGFGTFPTPGIIPQDSLHAEIQKPGLPGTFNLSLVTLKEAQRPLPREGPCQALHLVTIRAWHLVAVDSDKPGRRDRPQTVSLLVQRHSEMPRGGLPCVPGLWLLDFILALDISTH